MKGWVDQIRKIPNLATHSKNIPSEPEAKNVMNFTEQLLKLVYEIPSKAPPKAKNTTK